EDLVGDRLALVDVHAVVLLPADLVRFLPALDGAHAKAAAGLRKVDGALAGVELETEAELAILAPELVPELLECGVLRQGAVAASPARDAGALLQRVGDHGRRLAGGARRAHRQKPGGIVEDVTLREAERLAHPGARRGAGHRWPPVLGLGVQGVEGGRAH